MTGTVDEGEYNEKIVDIKISRPFDPINHDEDGFKHVENEVKIYKELTEVQGKYVPGMVVGGFENWYTVAAMVLVVEKLGHGLVSRGSQLYLDGNKLSDEEEKEIMVKPLEALEAVHACGVVHGDHKIDNIRLEKKNGKLHAWFIDFGLASTTDCEERKEQDKRSLRSTFLL